MKMPLKAFIPKSKVSYSLNSINVIDFVKEEKKRNPLVIRHLEFCVFENFYGLGSNFFFLSKNKIILLNLIRRRIRISN